MKKALCATLIATMTLLPLQAVRADMITLEQVSHGNALSPERQTLVKTLEAFGVPGEAAQARVAALSDEEARKLAAQAASAPAGGNIIFLFITLMGVFAILVYQSLHSK